MANLATTDYVIVSNKENIDKLFEVLNQANDSSLRIYKISEAFGIDWEKKELHVRGDVYWCDEPEQFDDELWKLSFATSTAWNACTDFFNALNKDAFDEQLSISYREIECGCEVYYVHDEYDFFPEQYCVDSSDNLGELCEECFDDAKSVIDYWCEKMNVKRHIDDDEAMIEYIDNYEYEDVNEYFSINAFCFG